MVDLYYLHNLNAPIWYIKITIRAKKSILGNLFSFPKISA